MLLQLMRIFECEFCDKMFSHKGNLNTNIGSIHWRLIVLFWEHYFWQNLHTKDFFATLIEPICVFKLPLWENILSQNSHSKSLINWSNMKTHATFLRKDFDKIHIKRFLWIMNRTNMCTFLITGFLTKITYKIFLCIMNRANMFIQTTFFRKTFVTKFTFKRLLPVMYRTNMKTRCTLLIIGFLAKSTYKRFLCIMNRTNMFIQNTFFRKTFVTKFTFKGFFPSCTEVTGRLSVLFENIIFDKIHIQKISLQHE